MTKKGEEAAGTNFDTWKMYGLLGICADWFATDFQKACQPHVLIARLTISLSEKGDRLRVLWRISPENRHPCQGFANGCALERGQQCTALPYLALKRHFSHAWRQHRQALIRLDLALDVFEISERSPIIAATQQLFAIHIHSHYNSSCCTAT